MPPFLCTWKVDGSRAARVHAVGEVDRASSSQLAKTLLTLTAAATQIAISYLDPAEPVPALHLVRRYAAA